MKGNWKVEVEEYAVIWDGKLTATRHGQEWRDLTGDNLVLSLAMALDQERERARELLKACEQILPILEIQPEPEIGDWNWRGLGEELAKAIQKAKEEP
jgi:hypothetical protein